MIVPEVLVTAFRRATRANAPFLSVDSARRAILSVESPLRRRQ
ncbi:MULTISPECIES: hypothetical protein [Microbacterium]|uniref:Uncharacterized protein n=1 Tax=Microbacterium profundi TaxID=450380 RepID=A0ABV3LHV6_9MICO|nr:MULTISPECIES: hypothetical protein [Microbacterium]